MLLCKGDQDVALSRNIMLSNQWVPPNVLNLDSYLLSAPLHTKKLTLMPTALDARTLIGYNWVVYISWPSMKIASAAGVRYVAVRFEKTVKEL